MAVDPTLDARWMRRGTNTGYWIIVLLSAVNGMDMGPQEWRDSLFICYDIEPPYLPTHCDGCNAKFLYAIPWIVIRVASS